MPHFASRAHQLLIQWPGRSLVPAGGREVGQLEAAADGNSQPAKRSRPAANPSHPKRVWARVNNHGGNLQGSRPTHSPIMYSILFSHSPLLAQGSQDASRSLQSAQHGAQHSTAQHVKAQQEARIGALISSGAAEGLVKLLCQVLCAARPAPCAVPASCHIATPHTWVVHIDLSRETSRGEGTGQRSDTQLCQRRLHTSPAQPQPSRRLRVCTPQLLDAAHLRLLLNGNWHLVRPLGKVPHMHPPASRKWRATGTSHALHASPRLGQQPPACAFTGTSAPHASCPNPTVQRCTLPPKRR